MVKRVRNYMKTAAHYHDPGVGVVVATVAVASVYGLLLLL